MFIARLTALAGIALATAAFAVTPAEALTTKECSAKYQAAKEAGTLGDMKWNDFRKTQCAAAATDDDDQATTTTKKKAAAKKDDDDDNAKGLTSKQCSAKYQAAKEAGTLGDMKWNDFRKAQCGPGASAEIEKPAKKKAAAKKDDDDDDAKGLTSKQCSAKYQAAKEAGTLGDMKWNDFRKAECGPGATAEIETKAKTKKAASTSDDDDAAKGLSMKDCSAKYQAAKEAGTLGDTKWNDFRKAECGPGATADSDSKAKKTAAKSDDDDDAKGLSMKDCSAKYQAAKEADTLGDTKWNDFRKAECGPGSSMEVQSKKSTKAVAKADTSGGSLTMKECSAKYQQAKADGKLGDLKWNSFRKAKCSADAADDETVPAPDEASYTNEPEAPTVTVPRGVKFPRGISSKYSNESEGKARMHTCLDQYYANKENDALGGLKWIQKGGGYYSLCNARLKAGA